MKKIIPLLIILLITSCNFLSKTKEEILAQQKPLPNTNTLRQKTLEALIKKIEFKDTLYVITSVAFGICGNDERFNQRKRIPTLEEIKKHQEYVKANPYYLDDNDQSLTNNYYEATTNFKSKTIITGSSFENETFKSGKNKQNIKSIKKPLYQLGLQIVDKDTVQATVIEFKTNEELQFILTRNDTLWKAH